MINTFDFGCVATKKVLVNESAIAIFVKDIGAFAFFYGGTAIFLKHWRGC